MTYSREKRLEIGQRIYNGEVSRYQASEEYGISEQTARDYMRLYRDVNDLPPKHGTKGSYASILSNVQPSGLEEIEAMTKDELILELVKARVAEARLKKGYEVKGDGTVIRYASKNTK